MKKSTTPKTTPQGSETGILLSREAAVAKFTALKDLVKERQSLITAIAVTNDSTYESLLMHVTYLNKVMKEIDEKRKESNAPAKSFIDTNNALAKEITGDAESVIREGKAKLKQYDDFKREQEEAERRKVEEQMRLQREAIEAQERKQKQLLANIANLVTEFHQRIQGAVELGDKKASLQALSGIKSLLLSKTSQMNLETEAFPQEMAQAYDDIVTMGKKASEDVRNGVYEPVQLQSIAVEMAESQAEHISEAANEAIVETQQAEMSVAVSTHNKASYRIRWTFELVDITKVPPSMIQLNEVAVNAWIRNMKDSEHPDLQDGKVVNGIRIVKKEEAVLR